MVSWVVWSKFLLSKVIAKTCLITLTSFSKQSVSWKILEICELCALCTDSQKTHSVSTLVAAATASTGGWGNNPLGGNNEKDPNLMSHLRTSHKDYNKCMQVSKEFPPAFFVSAKAQNYFGWLEWTVMGGNNFSFVSNELNRKFSKITSISRTNLLKLISELTKAVEQKVAADLPDSFVLVIDGWSFTSASTHYLAVFAVYQNEKQEGNSKFVLLAFSPLLVEEDLGAKSHVDFTTTALGYFNKTVCNVGFLIPAFSVSNLRWIPCTSNVAEWLVSSVSYVPTTPGVPDFFHVQPLLLEWVHYW